MARYLLKRLLSGLLVFYIFLTLLFFSFNILIPYDYVGTLSLQIRDPEERAALRAELGLDLPLWQQYLRWMGSLAKGDLGTQYGTFGRGTVPVTVLLKEALPSTLLVFVTGAVLAFWLGLWLGKTTAWRVPRWLSGPVTFGSVALYTSFPPWLAFLVVYLLIDRMQLVNANWIARRGFSRLLWNKAPYATTAVMAKMLLVLLGTIAVLYLVNRLSRRLVRRSLPSLLSAAIFTIGLLGPLFLYRSYTPYIYDIIRVALAPFITFVLLAFGDTMLVMQTSMADTRHEMYIQTARAKGLQEKAVRDRHAARNALLPVLSRFVINLPYLLTSIVIIEFATGWPGVGTLLFAAINNQDTYVYMGIMVVVGLIALVARLLLDAAHMLLDPRIRFGTPAAGGRATL